MTDVWRGSGLVLVVLTACAGGGVEQPKTQFDTAPQQSSGDPSTDGGEVTGDEPSTSTTTSTSGTDSESPSSDSSTGEAAAEDSTTGRSSEDTSTPEPDPVCGDGVAEGTEACDGSDLLGHGCSDFGFDGGTLSCLADCSGFDESGCTVAPYCGDGVKDPAEQCDTTDLAGQSCQSLGWDMGALACTANCTFDTSGCANAACTPIFGNCSQVPCCAGLFCLPINGHHCSPTP